MRAALSLLPMLFIAAASMPNAALAGPAEDEAAVIAYEHAACDAYKRNDAEAIVRLMDPTYTLTDSKGRVWTLAEELVDVRKGTTQYTEFRNHDMKVRLYGDTAVVTGITTIKGTSEGSPIAFDVQFTDTLLRRDGEWKMVAGHVSRLTTK